MIAAFVAWLSLFASIAQSAEADRLWNEGRRVEAVDAWARELAERPDDAALRARYVECALAIHRYEAALDAMGPPGEGRFADVRGVALYHLARYDEAVRHLDPTDGLQALMRVDSYEALGRLDEAERALDAAAAVLGEDDARVLSWRGRAAQRRGAHERAVELFRAALDADPWNAEALFGLGQSLVRTGAREEGLALLERHRELVELLDQLDYARRGIDLAPLHASNWAHAGDLEREIGRIDRAERAYGRALELATDDELVPIALRAARLLTEDRGDVDAAVVLLDQAATRVPDARLFVRAGDHLRAAGRFSEALARYERARARRPTDRAVLQRIAEVRAELDR